MNLIKTGLSRNAGIDDIFGIGIDTKAVLRLERFPVIPLLEKRSSSTKKKLRNFRILTTFLQILTTAMIV